MQSKSNPDQAAVKIQRQARGYLARNSTGTKREKKLVFVKQWTFVAQRDQSTDAFVRIVMTREPVSQEDGLEPRHYISVKDMSLNRKLEPTLEWHDVLRRSYPRPNDRIFYEILNFDFQARRVEYDEIAREMIGDELENNKGSNAAARREANAAALKAKAISSVNANQLCRAQAIARSMLATRQLGVRRSARLREEALLAKREGKILLARRFYQDGESQYIMHLYFDPPQRRIVIECGQSSKQTHPNAIERRMKQSANLHSTYDSLRVVVPTYTQVVYYIY